jgi:signal transduction histidine kinase
MRDQLNEQREKQDDIHRLAALGKMTAFITHELKNSLVNIGGITRLVTRNLGENSPERERLETVAEEVKRLEELTQNVLNFARRPASELTPHDVNEIAHEAFEAASAHAPGGIEFREHLATDLPPVDVDPTLMRQVFMNLLRNATEAIENEGTVTLKTTPLEDSIEVIIADTGTGMPPEVIENLFDLYYTTKSAGTGLGLAIAREIVEAHNGSIVCCSAEGEGSEFHISLPISGQPQTQ